MKRPAAATEQPAVVLRRPAEKEKKDLEKAAEKEKKDLEKAAAKAGEEQKKEKQSEEKKAADGEVPSVEELGALARE